MLLEINNEIYEFKFGVKFSRELDKRIPAERDGMTVFGGSLMINVLPGLRMGSIGVLSTVLKLSNETESPKIKDSDLEDYIENHEDIEKLFDEVLEGLQESNAGKLAMKNFNNNLEEANLND